MKGVEGKIANMSMVCACIVALSHVSYNADVVEKVVESARIMGLSPEGESNGDN